jgi:hypothetical protein
MAPEREIAAAVLPIQGALGPVVHQACAEAGIRAVPVEDGAPFVPPPSVIIAELRAGERRVPQRVLDAAALAGGRARLLLLCAESLVRPHIATQAGRIVMVSPPHTPAKLANRLRVLLAGHGLPTSASPLERRERITEHLWLCAFQTADGELGASPQVADGPGLTAVLPPPDGGADPELARRVVELLGRERSDDARLQGFSQLAGPCAVVHLSPNGDRWLFCWPEPSWPLWIHSAQRLPQHAEVSGRAAHQRAWWMTAAPGDLILASNAPLSAVGDVRAALRRAFDDGGPAAVDLVASMPERAEGPLAGLAIEVHG